jgi:hypothetical protein
VKLLKLPWYYLRKLKKPGPKFLARTLRTDYLNILLQAAELFFNMEKYEQALNTARGAGEG